MARRNVEAEEMAEDLRWRTADIIHKTDLYDIRRDAASEARYDDKPRSEPTLEDVKAEARFACMVDESAGMREQA